MEKNDWYKLIVIGIVALFVFQGIAIGLLQSESKGRSIKIANNGTSLSGQAYANVTILRYEPYVIVKGGEGRAVNETLARLVSEGLATYSIPFSEGLIVNLNSGKDAPAAAAEFRKANASVLASATITTAPKIRVQGADMSTTAEGTSFTAQINPSYDEGAIGEAVFAVEIENGVVRDIGNFMLLPLQMAGVRVNATLVGGQQSESLVEISWQNRSAARQIAKSEGASYKEKSYIIVAPNATKEQLAAAYANGTGYVTGVQAGLISVRNDFSDYSRASADMKKIGLDAVFPPSTATFENQSAEKLADLVQKLNAAGINATLVQRSIMKAALPEIVEAGGRKFKTGGAIVPFEQVAPIDGSAVELELGFQADGAYISKIISAKQATAQAG